jgi:hypothetical protein
MNSQEELTQVDHQEIIDALLEFGADKFVNSDQLYWEFSNFDKWSEEWPGDELDTYQKVFEEILTNSDIHVVNIPLDSWPKIAKFFKNKGVDFTRAFEHVDMAADWSPLNGWMPIQPGFFSLFKTLLENGADPRLEFARYGYSGSYGPFVDIFRDVHRYLDISDIKEANYDKLLFYDEHGIKLPKGWEKLKIIQHHAKLQNVKMLNRPGDVQYEIPGDVQYEIANNLIPPNFNRNVLHDVMHRFGRIYRKRSKRRKDRKSRKRSKRRKGRKSRKRRKGRKSRKNRKSHKRSKQKKS